MALPQGQDRAALGVLSGVLASAFVVLTSAANGRTVTAGIFAGVALFLLLGELVRLPSGWDPEIPASGRNFTKEERKRVRHLVATRTLRLHARAGSRLPGRGWHRRLGGSPWSSRVRRRRLFRHRRRLRLPGVRLCRGGHRRHSSENFRSPALILSLDGGRGGCRSDVLLIAIRAGGGVVAGIG